jgi:hypothetical protein
MLSDSTSPVSIYGFDARTSLDEPDPSWTDARRSQFLLRPDVSRPVSVDPRVWPSVLPPGLTDGPAPDYWADLAELRKVCVERGLGPRSAALVALAVVVESDAARALLVATEPSGSNLQQTPLGWDVADNGLVSALSNCGYLPEAIDDQRRTWAPALNQWGLFDDLESARAFRASADIRVPEHAPFLLHRVILVRW